MNTTLYSLFMPPKDCFGDFGLFCGFTAAPQVLRQIRRTFTGDMSRPVLAAFIHPTVDAVSDVPQLAWMWMHPRERGYNLLHAKVALLGFRRREDEGYVIRLAVSTGNWTQDSLTGSIDLFWSVDLDIADPQPQDVADIRVAWAMFDWLRARADCSLIERDYDGQRPDVRLGAAVRNLPASNAQTRFIDSRTQALFPQVVERLAKRRRADRLVLGSGYFETGGNGDSGLPERLRQALRERGALQRNAELDLFLNPRSCQGLAARAAALNEAGWTLRSPFSALHGPEGRLHAKFVLLASGETEVKGRVYLGSGNLSRNGFETAASSGGNLEAGVVVDLPNGLKWRGKWGIARCLPVQFSAAVTPTDLAPGESFVRPQEPDSMPPVSWMVWQDDLLSAPDDKTVKVIGADGAPVETPCAWPAPAPAIVTLAGLDWRLPVITDGVLVTQRPRDLTVEDILATLASFPEPSESDQTDDGPEGGEALTDGTGSPGGPQATYAIRRMMSLIVCLGEAQVKIDPLDWPRWCRELRQSLCAITAQENAMIGFFRDAGANPLPALADPSMLPDGADLNALQTALAAITKAWCLVGYPSLWDEEAA